MKVRKLLIIITALTIPFASQVLADEKAPTVDEQITGLQNMCSASAEARMARQTEKALFERLGGTEKITKMVYEIFRLHTLNPTIKHTVEGIDLDTTVKHLVDFISAGTGGGAKYTGRDLHSSHVEMKLTDAHFLSAGGDIMMAMKSLGHGQNEIDEFLCILVSLKDQVVMK